MYWPDARNIGDSFAGLPRDVLSQMVLMPSRYHWLVAVFALLLLACWTPAAPAQQAASGGDTAAIARPPGHTSADFWRSLKEGATGVSSVRGVESGVAMNRHGQEWRQARNRLLAPWGAWLLGGVLLTLAGFYAFRGPVRLEGEDDGTTIPRFSINHRIAHWFTASLFLLLAVTGLVLLYGRGALEPLFGARGFAAIASGAKEAHNLFGPIFLFALVLLISGYARDNLPQRGDLGWLAAGGGLFGRHASAWRFNLGEKAWFWLVCVLGLGLSLSGLVLDFAVFGWDRTTLELAHFLHVAAALILVAVSFGHVYLGTVGVEGTLRGMLGGAVERRWAALHHDLWLRQTESPAAVDDDAKGND